LGYTEDCRFTHNILYGNDTSVAVQKSRNNIIEKNIIAGGWSALDFNGDMAESNNFGENLWEDTNSDDDYFAQLNELPEKQRNAQILSSGLLADPQNGDFTPNAPGGFGTEWRPHAEYLSLYAAYVKAQEKANEAADFLQSKVFALPPAQGDECAFLTNQLALNGFANASAAVVLKSNGYLRMIQVTVRYGDDAYAQATTKEGVRIREAKGHDGDE
jgi:parallel beta-helix repeat protein